MSKSTYPTLQKWLRWSGLFLAIVLFSAIVISRANAETASFEITTVAFSKIFIPDTIGPGSITTLSFTIENPDSTSLNNLTFTDTLPVGVYIATPANAMATCESAVTAPNGGTDISFSADRLGPYSTCIITVDVTSIAFGSHMNVSGYLTSDGGTTHGNAIAYLNVSGYRPGFSKNFAPNPIPPGGVSTLELTIKNNHNQSWQSGLFFTDILPPRNAHRYSIQCFHRL